MWSGEGKGVVSISYYRYILAQPYSLPPCSQRQENGNNLKVLLRWMDNGHMVNIHNKILFNCKKTMKFTTKWVAIKYYIEWSDSHPKRQSMFSLICESYLWIFRFDYIKQVTSEVRKVGRDWARRKKEDREMQILWRAKEGKWWWWGGMLPE